MNSYLYFLYDVILLFLLISIIVLVFINKKKKNFNMLKTNDEVYIFIKKYNLDLKKLNYKNILVTVSLINSFILAFSATIILRVKSILLSILYALVLSFVLIYSLYEIAGKYFKKKEGK